MRTVYVVLSGLTLFAFGCGGGSTSGPTVKITSVGSAGAVTFTADSPDVDVVLSTSGIVLKDPGACLGATGCGHVELFVDGTTCNNHEDAADPKPYNHVASSTTAMAGLDYCPGFPAVAGSHTLRAELHKDDLSPIVDSNGKTISDSTTFTATLGMAADMGPTVGDCGSAGNPIVAGAGHVFAPAACSIAAGSTVHWKFTSSHTVTSDPGAAATFDSGTKSSGEFTFVVPAAATSGTVINYHCDLHATVTAGQCNGMCATLTVK